MSDEASATTGQKRRRTRSGCLNCRRKRKKCDETRPTCLKCERSSENCQWDALIKFRPPTGVSESRDSTPSGPVILRMGSDSEETADSSSWHPVSTNAQISGPPRSKESTRETYHGQDLRSRNQLLETEATDDRSTRRSTRSPEGLNSFCQHNDQPSPTARGSGVAQDGRNSAIALGCNTTTAHSMPEPIDSAGQTTDLVPHNSAIRSHAQGNESSRFESPIRGDENWTINETSSINDHASVNFATLPNHILSPSVSSGYHVEDGIFEPGSAYQNLFQSLRSQVFRTAQSELVTLDESLRPRSGNPSDTGRTRSFPLVEGGGSVYAYRHDAVLQTFELQPAQEYLLWKAWTEEVSIWLDKFDAQTHFRDIFPILAKERPHLKYAMLSLSARYLESRNGKVSSALTLALYQHTIQLLVPQLYMRDIAVIASCVILCVLEMFSCSPKAWRRHLDGCASLMQSLNLRGDSGGKEEAVFWCFARMDLCGGLISLERTLIPVDKWTSEDISEVNVTTYPRSGGFQDYAKMATNIIAQAMDLFASYNASEGAFGLSAANPLESGAYERRWRRLFDVVQEWFATRPMEMLPVMAVSAKECGSPFPTVLYSNAAAISGNQFAHTAAILMLQRKPRDLVLGKVRSILWHARQICGIALSNDHHGAWTNTVQPIWIAGRLMSHSQEHAAIVCLLKRIERETGWATRWRIDDLMEHWGDAED